MTRADSKRYFTALGEHIAQLRKSQGYTQAELARRIGVSQQAQFAYEMGERRVSVFTLTRLARVLKVSIQELASMARPQPPVVRQRLSPWAMRHAERLQALPKTKQRFVIKIIDSLEAGRDA